MKRTISLIGILSLAISLMYGQETENQLHKAQIGFSAVLPTGVWPATALTNMGTSSWLSEGGNPVKSYGFGLIIQKEIKNNIGLFFDGNMYNYNIFLAGQGEDKQSTWTLAEGAVHWDEPDAPQILYVSNLPTDVHFDMQTTGFRLGAKYYIGNNKARPWIGAAFGFYGWTVNYFNEDKTKTFGKDSDFVTGLTYLGGIDFEPIDGIIFTLFADLASPVAHYNIEGLFYDQWDIEYDGHIMGPYRFGLTISVE